MSSTEERALHVEDTVPLGLGLQLALQCGLRGRRGICPPARIGQLPALPLLCRAAIQGRVDVAPNDVEGVKEGRVRRCGVCILLPLVQLGPPLRVGPPLALRGGHRWSRDRRSRLGLVLLALGSGTVVLSCPAIVVLLAAAVVSTRDGLAVANYCDHWLIGKRGRQVGAVEVHRLLGAGDASEAEEERDDAVAGVDVRMRGCALQPLLALLEGVADGLCRQLVSVHPQAVHPPVQRGPHFTRPAIQELSAQPRSAERLG